jgi:hypothetical protein
MPSIAKRKEKTMSVPTSQCSVFVQIWVDTTAVQNGSTRGVYLVDNRVSSGSSSEGTAVLQTTCTQDSQICWEVFTVSPCTSDTVSIQSIGNSNAWGSSGQPEAAPDNSHAFTGQAQTAGGAGYQVTLNVQLGAGSGFTVTVSPSINVEAAARRIAKAA